MSSPRLRGAQHLMWQLWGGGWGGVGWHHICETARTTDKRLNGWKQAASAVCEHQTKTCHRPQQGGGGQRSPTRRSQWMARQRSRPFNSNCWMKTRGCVWKLRKLFLNELDRKALLSKTTGYLLHHHHHSSVITRQQPSAKKCNTTTASFCETHMWTKASWDSFIIHGSILIAVYLLIHILFLCPAHLSVQRQRTSNWFYHRASAYRVK